MKKVLSSIAMATLLSATTAYALPPQPNHCPSVSAIQAAGLMFAEQDDDGSYDVGQISVYDTNARWGFVVIVPPRSASSQTDALTKAKSALSTLSGSPAPISYNNVWVCLYGISNGYVAGAVTPIPSNQAIGSMVKFR